MHGAGLTYAALLSDRSGLVELVPEYWGEQHHFRKIALSQGIHYVMWYNDNRKYEYENWLAYMKTVVGIGKHSNYEY